VTSFLYRGMWKLSAHTRLSYGWKTGIVVSGLGTKILCTCIHPVFMGLPCRFSTRTYGYVGQFLHRLMIEAANLKYLPALENAKLSEAGFGLSQKSNKTLYHKYLLMTYNTFGIGATSVCTYYDHSGIMPYNIKTMRPWPWPCDSHRNSEEALKLMGRYVPCQQNLEQGPQYILKAIEMVEARYPAEHWFPDSVPDFSFDSSPVGKPGRLLSRVLRHHPRLDGPSFTTGGKTPLLCHRHTVCLWTPSVSDNSPIPINTSRIQ